LWTSAPKSNQNLDFDHPGDRAQYDPGELWQHQEELPKTFVTREMIENVLPAIWHQEIFEKDPVCDYEYHQIDEVMSEFDKHIKYCKKLGKMYNDDKKKYINQRKIAREFNQKAIKYCTDYYLLNNKQFITKASYENKLYYGVVDIREKNGTLTEHRVLLTDNWFENQALPGVKEKIFKGAKLKKFVELSEFDVSKKDQFFKIKYNRPQKGYTQGTFTMKNKDNETLSVTEEEAKEMFLKIAIEEAMLKRSSRRAYVSLPPGDVLSKKGMEKYSGHPIMF